MIDVRFTEGDFSGRNNRGKQRSQSPRNKRTGDNNSLDGRTAYFSEEKRGRAPEKEAGRRENSLVWVILSVRVIYLGKQSLTSGKGWVRGVKVGNQTLMRKKVPTTGVF